MKNYHNNDNININLICIIITYLLSLLGNLFNFILLRIYNLNPTFINFIIPFLIISFGLLIVSFYLRYVNSRHKMVSFREINRTKKIPEFKTETSEFTPSILSELNPIILNWGERLFELYEAYFIKARQKFLYFFLDTTIFIRIDLACNLNSNKLIIYYNKSMTQNEQLSGVYIQDSKGKFHAIKGINQSFMSYVILNNKEYSIEDIRKRLKNSYEAEDVAIKLIEHDLTNYALFHGKSPNLIIKKFWI